LFSLDKVRLLLLALVPDSLLAQELQCLTASSTKDSLLGTAKPNLMVLDKSM
jgi:hypothetical protein